MEVTAGTSSTTSEKGRENRTKEDVEVTEGETETTPELSSKPGRGKKSKSRVQQE